MNEIKSYKYVFNRCSFTCLGLSLLSALTAETSIAQSVKISADDTGTIVTQVDQQFEVSGGSLATGGEHLFHSFQNFHPNEGESVNFVTDPSIHNVFARVTGGNPAVINGELQVSGSQANLFLMNPAGVIFGPQATLNLPANFTVTTADAIGFDGNQQFRATGHNDYATLVGNPSTFAFLNRGSGVVVNEGHLALEAEQQLTMMGGHVTNLGTLSTPGGTITMAAVPDENIVRIHQEGQLLNLEIEANALPVQPEPGLGSSVFTPLSLPELLTNGNSSRVTQLTANADGTVSLSGNTAHIPTQSGTTVVSGRVDVAAVSQSSSGAVEHAHVGGTVSVLGDRVALLNPEFLTQFF